MAVLTMVHAPVASADPALPEVALRVDRRTLAKRIWRGVAADGTEFGFELEKPLKPEAVISQTAMARYVIVQEPEPVLEVALGIAPSAAAGIGWAVGNLHLELSADATRLLAPDEPAVRQLFARLQVPFTATTAVFRPGHFKRGALPAQELGPSHRHGKD
jgi:urease accessory protein